MAEIFNSRDLTLQATVPRLTVTAATIVPTATTFAKPRNVPAITPGEIDLNTVKVGFTNPAYMWSYRPSNSGTFITIAGATSTSYKITSNTFLSHKGLDATSVEYKLTISQPGWEDASTTVTINYTSAANDVPVATLNKTSIILPTDEFGVINYANTNSAITVSIGGTNIPYAVSGPNTFSITTSILPIGSVNVGAQSANTFGNLSNLTADLSTITYTVQARDADGVVTTIPLTQNIAKAVSGGSALVYKLISPAIVLRNQDNINFTPTTIAFGSKVSTGSAPPVNYGGRFVVQTSTDNVNYTTRYTSSINESSYEYALSDHGGAYVTSIKVSLYLAGGTTTLIDSEIIPVNREGQFLLNLTNDNHTISTDAANVVVSGLPVSSEAEIFLGLTKQTTGWTFAWTASTGITMAPGTAATSTVTVTNATTNGTVTVVATQISTGLTKTAVFSISRAIGGVNSYRLDLSNNNQTLRINADGVVTSPWPSTAVIVYNGSVVDTGWTFSATYSNSNITGTFNTGVTPNTFTLSAFPAVAGLDGYVDIIATKTDYATLTARLTLTKTTNAVFYEISASTNAVSKNASGVSTPNTLTFTAYRIDGNNVRAEYSAGVITLQSATAGSGFSALSPTTTTASSASYTIPANTPFVNIKGILTVSGTAVDNETVPVVSDGSSGSSIYTGTVYIQAASVGAPTGGSYNFANGILTPPTNTGVWSITQPTTSTTPTWACDYTFTGTPTSTVTAGLWTNLHIDAVKGDQGTGGRTSAVVEIYKTGGTTGPTGDVTYTFSTNTLTEVAVGNLNGWTITMPASSSTGVYMRKAYFSAIAPTDTATNSSTSWSASVLVAQNGATGDSGSATFVINRGAASTASPPPQVSEISGANIGRPNGNGIAGDIVTIYSTGSTNTVWRCTASGIPGSWIVQDSYLTGNLFVSGTITADKIKSANTNVGGVAGNTFELGTSTYGYNSVITAVSTGASSYTLQAFNNDSGDAGGSFIAGSKGGYAGTFQNIGTTGNNFYTIAAIGAKSAGVIGRYLGNAPNTSPNFVSEGYLANASEGGLFQKWSGGVVSKKISLANASYSLEVPSGGGLAYFADGIRSGGGLDVTSGTSYFTVGSFSNYSSFSAGLGVSGGLTVLTGGLTVSAGTLNASGGATAPNYNYAATTSSYILSDTIVFAVLGSTTLQMSQGLNTSYKGISPVTDNAAGLSLGTSSQRWTAVWATNGTIQTSDSRLKTDVQNSNLGLNFINQLRPVSYKFISGGKAETGEFVETTVAGTDIVHKEPIYEDVPGIRTHYGLLAQEVKTTLDTLNTGDFGGFVLGDKNDPNSSHHLRYEEFISPLIKAVQELSAKVTALENRLNS